LDGHGDGFLKKNTTIGSSKRKKKKERKKKIFELQFQELNYIINFMYKEK
jgi:uncharacterized protein YggL (DUF469 family)